FKQVGWALTEKINQAPANRYVGCYRMLRDPVDGQINRVFALFAPETQFYALMAQEREAGKIIFLIDNQGNIVSSTERDMAFANAKILHETDENGLALIDQPLDSLVSQSFITYDGQSYAFIRTQFSQSSIRVLDWSLVSLIPAGSLAESVQMEWIKSSLVSVAFILVALIMLFGVARNITRRVQNLIAQMQAVISSNYKTRINSTGQDEIGLIGQNLSNMVDKTRTLIDEVYEANLQIKDAEISRQRLQTEKREAEIIALQEQINPHYLFNTLETIRMNLIIANDWKNAEIVEIFAESFRHAMDSTREFYTLGEELNLVRRFFKIQEFRFRGQVQLTIDVD
ncbi:MAG: sensor histidine kinase, partial [Erysipelotrichia bacterium]|nr:sensor histidine kinase [Erysipelotrichia bacterium]